MSDWEADDYDPNLNLAAKIVELGLSENTNNEPKLAQQKNVKVRTGKNKLDANSCRDLTEDEKRKAQIESDGQHVVDLFGISPPRNEGQRKCSLSSVPDLDFEELRTKEDFLRCANKLGTSIAKNSNQKHYIDLANTLVDHIVKPMRKLQLQIVQETIKKYIDLYDKKEQAEKEKIAEAKEQKKTKKAKKQRLSEDFVEDEYSCFAELEG